MVIVAPYVGAWIETLWTVEVMLQNPVAPYVGAWIETNFTAAEGSVVKSHPTWVRGLKLERDVEDKGSTLSHPTWVRGLKHGRGKGKDRHKQSHPTWVRGLKPVAGNDKYKTLDVAPYVGAWIETS